MTRPATINIEAFGPAGECYVKFIAPTYVTSPLHTHARTHTHNRQVMFCDNPFSGLLVLAAMLIDVGASAGQHTHTLYGLLGVVTANILALYLDLPGRRYARIYGIYVIYFIYGIYAWHCVDRRIMAWVYRCNGVGV